MGRILIAQREVEELQKLQRLQKAFRALPRNLGEGTADRLVALRLRRVADAVGERLQLVDEQELVFPERARLFLLPALPEPGGHLGAQALEPDRDRVAVLRHIVGDAADRRLVEHVADPPVEVPVGAVRKLGQTQHHPRARDPLPREDHDLFASHDARVGARRLLLVAQSGIREDIRQVDGNLPPQALVVAAVDKIVQLLFNIFSHRDVLSARGRRPAGRLFSRPP